jgi:hypothetical protein
MEIFRTNFRPRSILTVLAALADEADKEVAAARAESGE